MKRVVINLLLVAICVGCTKVSKESRLGIDDLQPSNIRPFKFKYERPNETGVVAEFEGTSFTEKELLKRSGTLVDLDKKIDAALKRKIHISKPLIMQELKTCEFMEKIRVLEQFAINRVLYLDSKKHKKPMGNFIKDKFESAIPAASRSELLSYALSRGFDEDKLKSNPRLKDNFTNEIFRRRLEIKKREYIRDELGQPEIVIRFDYPTLTIGLGNLKTINIGEANAKHLLVLFNGYRCGQCQKINQEVAKMVQSHPEKVYVKLIHYPNVADTEDRVLSEAVQCLGDEDVESLVSVLRSFQTVSNSSPEDKFYGDIGKRSAHLEKSVRKCVSDKDKMSEIDSHVMMARELGVRSIPLVMIDDLTFLGSQAYDEIVRLRQSLDSKTEYFFFERRQARAPASGR